MCGRFTLTADMNTLQSTFPWMEMSVSLNPRFNIAPTQPISVIINNGKNQLNQYIWGLIPSWAKDPSIGNRMINARAETLTEKPSFRTAFIKRRCLILADGFFEWKKETGKSKTPYYFFHHDRKPFAFAGLWDTWHPDPENEVRSCTIITTEPNELISPIHNRMPVILPSLYYTSWLDPAFQNPTQLSSMLKPYPAELISSQPVSSLVNNPNMDIPECILPIS
jgi:putative SOS response-associated peptidase YedK